MAVPPPRDPWHRRYWGYYNRPYSGFGCLWTFLLIILAWYVLSLFFRGLVFW